MDTQFAIQFPIIKAVTHNDGTMEFEGIASDEGLDLENEIVKASGWTDSLGYLTQKGRVGWNHAKVRIGDKVSNVPIGDVVEAKIVSPAWISDHFGELTAAPIGHGVYVRGMLYKPNEDMLPDQERALMLARGTLAGGGSLGISLEGARVGSTADPEGITHTPRAVCHTVELTPSPMNGRTFAVPVRLAKSLSEALCGEGELTEPAVFICKGYGAADAAPGIMPSGYVRLLSADVRDALAAEQEATIQYEAAAAKAGHPLVREVLLRVAEEERVHAGEFQRLLETLLADEAALNAKGAAEVDEMTGRLTGKEMAKALRQVVEEAREAAVTDPVEDAGAESGGVLRDMAKALAGAVGLLKGCVKPHTRKTKSGKVVQMGGYNTSRQAKQQAADAFRAHQDTGEPLDEEEVEAIHAAGLADRGDFENTGGGMYRYVPRVQKALSSGSDLVTEGATGGQTLRTQQIDRGVKRTGGMNGKTRARHLRCLLKALQEGDWATARRHGAALSITSNR